MKEKLEKILNIMTDTGSTYSDIFIEEKEERSIKLIDSKIDKVDTFFTKGVGLRVCDEHNTFYSALQFDDINELNKEALKLSNNLNKERLLNNIVLNELFDNSNIKEEYQFNDLDKKKYLLNIDSIARNYSDKIFQVRAMFNESVQDVIIATSDKKYVKDKRLLKRLVIVVMAQKGDKKTQSIYANGSSFDYSFLSEVDINNVVADLCESAINKLDAPYAPKGVMPVIISNHDGVLIHEACGHALEATSVADDASILSNCLNKKVASDIVTIIDDGSIINEYGSTYYDDEGEKTRKNVLVENGILKSYLVDKKNSKRMNHEVTASARRESYHFSPTSRMNNTYLDNGLDKLEDMIQSIDFGLYAKVLGGGEVNPTTGDFNFGVNEAYVIRDGKLCEMVIGASLIGNIKDVLNNIVAVSNDLNMGTGTCGSESGWCPVTCGQPTIKLSNILVGGKNE